MGEDISNSSPEFLFGKILAKVEGLQAGASALQTTVDQHVRDQAEQFREFSDALATLPCEDSGKRLKVVEQWKDGVAKLEAEEQTYRARQGLKLWHGIVLLGIGTAMSLITGLVLRLG